MAERIIDGALEVELDACFRLVLRRADDHGQLGKLLDHDGHRVASLERRARYVHSHLRLIRPWFGIAVADLRPALGRPVTEIPGVDEGRSRLGPRRGGAALELNQGGARVSAPRGGPHALDGGRFQTDRDPLLRVEFLTPLCCHPDCNGVAPHRVSACQAELALISLFPLKKSTRIDVGFAVAPVHADKGPLAVPPEGVDDSTTQVNVNLFFVH